MHGVVVRVRVNNDEQARQALHGQVVPGVKQAPGFQSGVWLAPQGESGEGLSIVVFDNEENANAAAQRARETAPAEVEMLGVEVREIAAQA